MSQNSGAEFDLEKLFLPSWAQGQTSVANRYADFPGEREPRRDDRRDDRRGPRRDAPGRPGEQRRGPAGAGGGGGMGARRPAGGGPAPRRDDRGPRRDFGPRPEPRPEPAPLPEVETRFLPDEKGVESMAVQIRRTGRAYPLFDIAHMILQKPERHAVQFTVKKNAEGQPVQPLFKCALDETLWLSEDEAVAYILEKHFDTFYQSERTQTEPPKGVYTFVGQCGVSGVILGPPNHHAYQARLRDLHAERFSRMPFEMFKSRVKIVRDEAVVKKWIDDQSWKTEYVALNVPEPVRFATREEVEQHFRATHLAAIVSPIEKLTLPGTLARMLPCQELRRLVRVMGEDQVRFPLQLAMTLSQIFAGHGLQFFKVNKTVTHVAVARPRHLDLEATLVSDGVKRIVDFVNAHRKCNRRDLIEALAPTPVPVIAPAVEGAVPATPESAAPTAQQMIVISDLHWLIHEGHVTEYHDGRLEVARKPQPKPPAPERKPREARPATEAKAKPAAEVPAGEAPTSEDLASEAAGHAPAEESAPESVEAAPVEPAPAASTVEPTPTPVVAEATPSPEATESQPATPPPV